jgi:CheY-like chemotaxis protein
MTILIVDDSKDSSALIELYLKKGGYPDILSADSALSAYEILGINSTIISSKESKPLSVDLILMDIVIPIRN